MNAELPEHSPNRHADQDDQAGTSVSDSERCLQYLLGELSPSEQAAFAEALKDSESLSKRLLQEAEFLSGFAAMEWGTTTAVSNARSGQSAASSTDAAGGQHAVYPTAVVPRFSTRATGWSCLLSAAVAVLIAVAWRYGLPDAGPDTSPHLADSSVDDGPDGSPAPGSRGALALNRHNDVDPSGDLATIEPLSEELMAAEVAKVIADATSLDDLVPLENVLDDSADELEASRVAESYAEPFESEIGESEEWILTATVASMEDEQATEDGPDG